MKHYLFVHHKLFVHGNMCLIHYQAILILAEKLVVDGSNFAEAWNFGPEESDAQTVSWVLDQLSKKFINAKWEFEKTQQHEASSLNLDISKANQN